MLIYALQMYEINV